MKIVLWVAFVLVAGLVGLCGYWYLNPQRAPAFVRDYLPGVEAPSPKNPVRDFRGPKF